MRGCRALAAAAGHAGCCSPAGRVPGVPRAEAAWAGALGLGWARSTRVPTSARVPPLRPLRSCLSAAPPPGPSSPAAGLRGCVDRRCAPEALSQQAFFSGKRICHRRSSALLCGPPVYPQMGHESPFCVTCRLDNVSADVTFVRQMFLLQKVFHPGARSHFYFRGQKASVYLTASCIHCM